MPHLTCVIVDCDKPVQVKSRGWCPMHYQRWRKYGDPLREPAAPADGCSVDDCGQPHKSRGLCRMHYARWKRHGDPLLGAFVPPSVTGCLVDDCAEPHHCQGYCRLHYSRWQRHRDPMVVVQPHIFGRSGCLVEGCEREHHSDGYCRAHYSRWRKTGEAGESGIRVRREETTRVDGAEAECQGCGATKRAGDFYMYRGSEAQPIAPYRRQPCKECVKAERQEWRLDNPELLSERQVGYQLRFKYDMTPDEYDALLVSQGCGCAICGAPQGSNKSRHHVDHDHETGRVRGILCLRCNTAIGLLRDDLALVRRAVAYLQSYAA